MIERVIKALTEKDYNTIAECFSDDCTYIDYCPSLFGESGIFIYGKYSLEMILKNKFRSGAFEVSEPLVESETRASFFSVYDGPYVFARLDIEEYDDAGLIKKAVVHPA